MKRYRRLGILAAVLVVLCVVVFAVSRVQTRQEEIQRSEEIVLALPADSVTKLAWTNEEGSFSFHLDDGVWYWDDDDAFPVDKEIMEELLAIFEEFDSSFMIENVDDYAQYGLDKPVCTISFTADGADYEIKLGNFSALDEERYVSLNDGKVYLMKEDPLDTFNVVLEDVIRNDVVPDADTLGAVRSLAVEGPDSYTAEYIEDSGETYCADDVYFTVINGKRQALDSSRVSSYIKNVAGLDLGTYVTYNASEEELKTYGLDDPEITVTIGYAEEDDNGEEGAVSEFTFSLSRDAKTREQAAAGEEEEEEASDDEEEESIPAYVRVGTSGILYEVDEAVYDKLIKAGFDDLRHQKIFTGSFDDVTEIRVNLDGNAITITTREPDEENEEEDGEEKETGEKENEDDEEERVYYYNGEECSIESLKAAVEALKASSFTDEKPAEKEEVSFTLYLDNENFPSVDIALYRYDGDSCLALLDGEPIAFVPRSQVVNVIEAVNKIIL